MKLLTIILTIVLLAGCTSLTSLFTKGAAINDDALIAAEAVICKGASIGSIMRRYGVSEAKAKAWKDLCSNQNVAAETLLND